jgi:hypothetical protein
MTWGVYVNPSDNRVIAVAPVQDDIHHDTFDASCICHPRISREYESTIISHNLVMRSDCDRVCLYTWRGLMERTAVEWSG